MKYLNKKNTIISISSFLFVSSIVILLLMLHIKNDIKDSDVNNILTISEEIIEENEIVEEEIIEEEIVEESVSEIKEDPINNNNIKQTSVKVTTNTTQTSTPTSNGKPYYIKVNYLANVVTIYGLDENGTYTVPIKAMICSSGTSTPRSGKYRISAKYRWLSLFGGVHGQYATQIVGNILFHSVPYLKKYDPASLEYWEYDKLGTAASMGCIRLSVIDAKWIYDNVAYGTIVEFYSDSNPGPLGKPYARKISDNENKNWDPTDPDPNNPWHSVIAEPIITETETIAESPVTIEQPIISEEITPVIEEPINPTEPVIPENPSQPEITEEPEPELPETPAEPEQPEEPHEPDNSSEQEISENIDESSNP